MIQGFSDPDVASPLDWRRASAQNGGMMGRGWSRSVERRRGVATLLATVASALPGCREARFVRQQFEADLCELMNAREGELRDGPAMPRPPEATISVDVVSGALTLDAIDATFAR